IAPGIPFGEMLEVEFDVDLDHPPSAPHANRLPEVGEGGAGLGIDEVPFADDLAARRSGAGNAGRLAAHRRVEGLRRLVAGFLWRNRLFARKPEGELLAEAVRAAAVFLDLGDSAH